jgi:hypothetical protein
MRRRLTIRTIDGSVAPLKQNEVWALIDSMILLRNTRTAVFILLLSCIAFQTTISQPYAQDDGLFFMERPKLGLNGYYRLEDEKRHAPQYDTTTKSQDFRESMTVATNGWIYHPNLMEYHISFEPQWEQEMFRLSPSTQDSTESNEKNTSLLAYDVGTTLLKNKPVSLDFFADRKTGQIDFSNAQNSDLDSESLGARLNLTNPTLPLSLALIHRQLDEDGFYQWREDRDEVQATIRHNAKNSVTQLNVLYDNVDRKNRTSFDNTDFSSKTMSTELTNAYSITDDNRVRLDSQIYNMDADYDGRDQDTWIVSENLYWALSQNLLTRYYTDYNWSEFGGSVNQQTRLGASLTHHLDDRLTTDLGAAAVINDYDDGSEDRYLSNLGFLYRRPIPWGSVQLGAAYDYALTKRSGTENLVPTDERLALSTGTETSLDKENVDLESIVVTDVSSATVYTENIDYRIETVGTAVSISRTLMGAIADGQQVSVHYNYRKDAGYDDSRFGQKYQFSLALWSAVYLSYWFRRIDQDILSGEPPNNPQNDTSNTVRLGFVTKWSDTELLYDNQDRSNSNSCVTISASQRINLQPARNFFLNFLGSIGDRDFRDINEEEKFYSVGASVGWTPRSWFYFSLNYLRNDISGDRRDELDSEFSTTVKLRYGVWTSSISYRLRDQDDKENNDSLWRQEMIIRLNRHLW